MALTAVFSTVWIKLDKKWVVTAAEVPLIMKLMILSLFHDLQIFWVTEKLCLWNLKLCVIQGQKDFRKYHYQVSFSAECIKWLFYPHSSGELTREEDVLEWLVQNKSTGDEEDVIEDVTAKALDTLIGSVDNLVVLFCKLVCILNNVNQGSADFFGYYPKIYLCATILPPRPESEEKRTNCF
jgi:hypothetical protein